MKKVVILIIFLAFLTSFLSPMPVLCQSVKGQSLKMHKITLNPGKSKQNTGTKKVVIGFIGRKSFVENVATDKAAFDFLNGLNEYQGEYHSLGSISYKAIQNYPLLWFHDADTAAFNRLETQTALVQGIKTYIKNGGNLLLSMHAFHYLIILGVESISPYDSLKPAIDQGHGKKLGIHSLRDHPVFKDMNGGAYLLVPEQDQRITITGFFNAQISKKGSVIGVDWDDIHIRENSKLVIEYSLGKGKIIAVGAYMDFISQNLNREYLELFTRNIFDYLTGKFE